MSAYVPFNKAIYYSLSPRILRVGERSTLMLTDCFKRHDLPEECVVQIVPVTQFNNRDPLDEVHVRTENGGFSFSYTFPSEQQYQIRLFDAEGKNLFIDYAVYALADDLFALKPYKGDLHLHTLCSDGLETPEHMVCASREQGLDFVAITDHNKYEPSLQAIEGLTKLPQRMLALRGEEVHAGAESPLDARCPVHILSLDADYAIAPFTSFQSDEEYEKAREALERDFEELAAQKPWLKTMGKTQALELLHTTKTRREQLLARFDDPTHTVDPEGYVFALDAFEHIKQAGGFSVLCHTQWRFLPTDTFSQRDDAPLSFVQKLIAEKPFDVYEAASYAPKETASRNLMQVKLLADAGHLNTTPLIGISDSHTTLPTWNELGTIYTVAFVEEFSRQGLREAIVTGNCVAVENYEDEDVRCYGSYRLSLYAEFLIDHFFSDHDAHCKAESALMYTCLTTEGPEADTAARLLEELCQLHHAKEKAWWAQ